MYYFSPSRKGIFIEVQKQLNPEAFPEDAKPISKELRDALVLKTSEGFLLSSDKDGNPITVAQAAPSLSELKVAKQLDVAQAAQQYIDAVTQDFAPTFERESYTLQAAEAARWMLDKKASTPILDGIAAARGVDPTALKTKAYEKSQQYQALCAVVTGQRQALEDEINAASTVGALNLIQPSERFKVPS